MHSGRQAIEFFFELSLYLFVATGFIAVAATGRLFLAPWGRRWGAKRRLTLPF